MNNSEDILFTDFDYSFLPHPKTGDITILKNNNAVKNAVKNLLLTKYGQVLFNSKIGCGINYKLFDILDNITINSLKRDIIACLSNFEPRVTIENINVKGDIDNYGIYITLYFSIINIQNTQKIDVFLERVR